MSVSTSAGAAQTHPPGIIARVCREIRNPLNAVLGFARLLEGDRKLPLSQRQRQQLQAIDQAAHHILHLVDDALQGDCRKEGAHDTSQDPVELDRLVDNVMGWMGPAARQAGITLAHSSKPMRVRGDVQYLQEVLINLVSNAIKYNRPAGEVRVTVGPGDRPGSAHLVVEDTGPGIDQSGLSRLFRPYERLDAGNRGIEGTGLGLCITRQLVERMGGSVQVSSRVGVGTVFIVQLQAA
jgi:signal transduction histidine kinase